MHHDALGSIELSQLKFQLSCAAAKLDKLHAERDELRAENVRLRRWLHLTVFAAVFWLFAWLMGGLPW